MLKFAYLENALVRTSSLTSFPRSPQNKRKSSVEQNQRVIVSSNVIKCLPMDKNTPIETQKEHKNSASLL